LKIVTPENFSKNINRKACLEYNVTEPIGLLNFILLNVSGKSRNNIKSLLTHREVSVDGVTVTQHNYNLQSGQKVCIKTTASRAQKDDRTPDIIYEDNEIIVINKPAGLVTVATDTEKDNTAYSLITDYVQRKNRENKIFVVHRLDRDTSGVLLFAKNDKIKYKLQDNWADLVKFRGYIAIVEGKLENKSGQIKSWLRQTKTLLMYSSNISGDGLEAITNYKVMNENSHYSMVDIQLETGRKNQIRVHMKDIGHSVIGDKKYGAETNPIKRLGLHAYKLELSNPISGETMIFEAPIPLSFSSMFKK